MSGVIDMALLSQSPAPAIPLLILNRDRSVYVQVKHDGTVTGDLAEKYPDSHAAIAELTLRIVNERFGR